MTFAIGKNWVITEAVGCWGRSRHNILETDGTMVGEELEEQLRVRALVCSSAGGVALPRMPSAMEESVNPKRQT